MKIVATSDTHFPLDKEELFPDGDVLVIAGDVLYAGNIREWYPFLESLGNPWIQKYKHKLFVPGNHDLFFQHYAGPCLGEMRDKGFFCLTPTRPRTDINGVSFGGSPYVTGLPNWAYNTDEGALWRYLDSIGRVDVMITHAPPRGVLDSDGKGSYGTKAMRTYLSKFQPEILICGHVHEEYGTRVIGRTHVYNACMCNGNYKQVNVPHVIEL